MRFTLTREPIMKDKLLYLTIGVLIGIIVMQWAMPAGQASLVTAPVGNVIAASNDELGHQIDGFSRAYQQSRGF